MDVLNHEDAEKFIDRYHEIADGNGWDFTCFANLDELFEEGCTRPSCIRLIRKPTTWLACSRNT
jgi:hypothetical protein